MQHNATRGKGGGPIPGALKFARSLFLIHLIHVPGSYFSILSFLSFFIFISWGTPPTGARPAEGPLIPYSFYSFQAPPATGDTARKCTSYSLFALSLCHLLDFPIFLFFHFFIFHFLILSFFISFIFSFLWGTPPTGARPAEGPLIPYSLYHGAI